MLRYLFTLAAAVGLCAGLMSAGCSRGYRDMEVLGTLERDRLELTAESNERIVELPVPEGDRVPEGALLARQEAGTMEPRLQQSRASVAEAERRLEELVNGPRAREVDAAGGRRFDDGHAGLPGRPKSAFTYSSTPHPVPPHVGGGNRRGQGVTRRHS